MRRLTLSLLASAAVALTAAPAVAAGDPNAGLQELRDWNLIVLGDVNSTSEVEGRTFIGGDLGGGASNYYINPNGASTPGLVVAGNVTSQIQLNNGGGAEIGGNQTGAVNLNGSGQTLIVGGTAQNINGSSGSQITVGAGSVGGYFNANGASFSSTLPTNFASGLQSQATQYRQNLAALSQYFAGLAATDSYTISGGNQINFSPAGSGKIAVFDLSSTSALAGLATIDFSTNGFDTVVVNVGGTSDAIPSSLNFGGASSGLGEKVIWNFYDATSLTFSGSFDGSVLAPFAAITTSNYIQGSAVFASLDQNGEVHMGNYAGSYGAPGVPEPACWAMMLVGVFGVGALMRARRSQGLPLLGAG